MKFTPVRAARQAAYWRSRGRVDVAQRIEAELWAAGCCQRCGRALSNPASVERGVGPECYLNIAIERHREEVANRRAGERRAEFRSVPR